MARPEASADVFRAIADPTRRALLDLLAQGERSAGSLAESFDLCHSTVSEHLRLLRVAGLVAYTETGGRRIYRLVPGPLSEVAAWVEPHAGSSPPAARAGRRTSSGGSAT